MGEVFFAGEESEEGAALLRVVVADGSAQHGIAGLERIQHRTLRDRALYFERHLAADVRQGSEMEGEDDADHVGRHNLYFNGIAPRGHLLAAKRRKSAAQRRKPRVNSRKYQKPCRSERLSRVDLVPTRIRPRRSLFPSACLAIQLLTLKLSAFQFNIILTQEINITVFAL